MRALALALLVIPLLLSSACSTSHPVPTASDAGADRGTPLPPDSGPPGPWAFASDDDGSKSPAVSLKLEGPVTDDSATLLVLVRGVSQLQGVAFRLALDPARVKVVKSELGEGWVASGAQLVSRFTAQPDGELWAGIGHAGSHGLLALKETSVARLQLKLSGSQPIAIAFRPQHNLVLDPEARAIKAEWLGGKLHR